MLPRERWVALLGNGIEGGCGASRKTKKAARRKERLARISGRRLDRGNVQGRCLIERSRRNLRVPHFAPKIDLGEVRPRVHS